jgi:NTE family protein
MMSNSDSPRRPDPASPVSLIDVDRSDLDAHLEPGIALCLSGGGYRAMLFHAGTLWRLNDFGYLPKLTRVSSVSGGSITAGVLGLNWNRLDFNQSGVAANLTLLLVDPIRRLASITIDAESIIAGIALPGTIAERVAAEYRKYLFGHATLQDLPDAPRFVFNATNVQSGALWRFSKPFMADYRVGVVKNPRTEIAVAVGASSAFPPVLSPVELRLEPSDFDPQSGLDLQREPFTGGIRTNILDYQLADALECPFDQTTNLANTPTRLKRLDSLLQDRIINWGYAVCDAAMRKHVDQSLPRPSGFPYPGSMVG